MSYDVPRLFEEGVNYPPNHPTQEQLFHQFIVASARGHRHAGSGPREVDVHCICGWSFHKSKGLRKTTYKKQMQELYRTHVRDALDCDSLFATWATGRIV